MNQSLYVSYIHILQKLFCFQSWGNNDADSFNEEIKLHHPFEWVCWLCLWYIIYLLAPIGNLCLFRASIWNQGGCLQNKRKIFLLIIGNAWKSGWFWLIPNFDKLFNRKFHANLNMHLILKLRNYSKLQSIAFDPHKFSVYTKFCFYSFFLFILKTTFISIPSFSALWYFRHMN